MAVNPVGYVCPYDGADPQSFNGIAWAAISGGELCHTSGAADCVSSGVNSYATTDIGIAGAASGAKFNGIAMTNAASGGTIAVQTKGICIITAGGTIVNGEIVLCAGADCVIPSGSRAAAYEIAQHKMGRALTNATSGNYALIQITP